MGKHEKYISLKSEAFITSTYLEIHKFFNSLKKDEIEKKHLEDYKYDNIIHIKLYWDENIIIKRWII